MKNYNTISRLSIVLISALCALSVPLSAQNIPQRGPIPFSIYDTNKDGFVSQTEFRETRAKRMSQKAKQGMPMRNNSNAPDFNMFDVDKNGKLSKLELREGQNRQMRKNRANKNLGQGMMRRDTPTFKSFDLDGDGYLKGSEMKEARAKRIEQRKSQGKMLMSTCNISEFSEVDLDGDGKVTKEEFRLNQIKNRK